MSAADRAHGVTPGLRRDYAGRTAGRQAAFVLPHLHPGTDLIDVGCGPGTISAGLAAVVTSGHVVGLDHDADHVAAAKSLALERGLSNATFLRGDALSLPFPAASFQAAFENDMFIHLAERAEAAAREVWRVLKPGGLFAARDADAGLAVWSHPSEDLRTIDRLMRGWQESRGSDIRLGSRLPGILRQAGFVRIVKSVSADTKGDVESVRSHAEITAALLEGPLGQTALKNGWADRAELERLTGCVRAWAAHPDAYFANIHIEVIGWKLS